MYVLFLLYLSVCPSAFANTRSEERIFMTFDDIQFFFNFLTPSNCGLNLATVPDTFHKHLHAFCCSRKHNVLNVQRNENFKQ